MRSVITFAAFALAAGVIVPRYAAQSHAGGRRRPMMAAHPVTAGVRRRRIRARSSSRPARNGHFRGRRPRRRPAHGFHGRYRRLGDRADRARRGDARHPSGAERYVAMVRTANGTVRAAPVMLDMVEIDDIVVHNVAAMVMPDGALSDNLLGLSFLSTAAALRILRRQAGAGAVRSPVAVGLHRRAAPSTMTAARPRRRKTHATISPAAV